MRRAEENTKIKNILFFIFILSSSFCAAEEFRGVWIATVKNLDWPSRPGMTKEAQQAELVKIFDGVKEMGFNTVILQVRPMADTFWPSKLEPWSVYLTGTPGKNPGYDPLGFAVEEAHKRGLKIHAWFNPFRVTADKTQKPAENSPAEKHKDWVIKYGDGMIFDPGNPAARKHITAVITEAAAKYDVDGVHLDDYFYPYPQVKNGKEIPLDDKKSFKKYAAKGQKLEDWRRQNINIFISDLRKSIKAAKPGIQFGISPFAVWRNADECPGGSDTTGFSSHDKLFTDVNAWLDRGYLDYVAPQIYWEFGHRQKPFDKVLAWWTNKISSVENPPALYAGIAAYKDGAPFKAGEIEKQIKHARENGAGGFIYFRAKFVLDEKSTLKNRIKNLNKGE